ncbi:hypothetical protein D9M71_558930 [compost metagenome]
MLDRLEALAGGQFDGGGGDVVLQVDELLGGTGGGFVVGDLEQCDGRLFLACKGLGHDPFNGLETRFNGSESTTFETIGQGIGQGIHTVDATDADALLRCITGYEGENIFTPDRLATQM